MGTGFSLYDVSWKGGYKFLGDFETAGAWKKISGTLGVGGRDLEDVWSSSSIVDIEAFLFSWVGNSSDSVWVGNVELTMVAIFCWSRSFRDFVVEVSEKFMDRFSANGE